jgi:hypothetical protein
VAQQQSNFKPLRHAHDSHSANERLDWQTPALLLLIIISSNNAIIVASAALINCWSMAGE